MKKLKPPRHVSVREQSKEWTPVLKGDTFCAPRCGGGCTVAMFNAAVRRAAKLIAALGTGWKAEIWENLGWHYVAISPCGRWHIHTHHYVRAPVSYNAFLGAPNRNAGGKWAESGNTPRAAMLATVARVEDDIGELGLFGDIRESIPKGPARRPSRVKPSPSKLLREGTWKGHRR